MPLDPAAQLFCSFTIEKTEDRQERAALVQLPSGHRDQEQPLVPAHAVGAQFQAGTGTTALRDVPQTPAASGVALPSQQGWPHSAPAGVIPER